MLPLWSQNISIYKTLKNGKNSNLSMFKSRKNFEKMDKKNVQKSNRRNLFVQKRAALGDLRNFFWVTFARAFMVS
jgi:hypothetical protein